MPGLQSGNEADLVGVAKVLGLKDAAELGELRPSRLMRLTQRELLDAARVLGLTKVSKLNKQALLAKVWEALQLVGVIPVDAAAGQPAVTAPRKRGPSSNGRSNGEAAAPASAIDVVPDARPAAESPTAAVHKFDVGEGTGVKPTVQDFAKLRAEAQAHIPWSYGQDKVTALPVDPDRLFVYWEVTQTAIDQARGGLGPAGKDAWLSLRVYDVTGRLFDGNNAHSYFDQGVGNDVRQWFFDINRPTSQAIVEIGLKSSEGYFVKIARSGRMEFPRKEPVAWSDPEWMTVQVSTGYVEGTGVGLAAGWGGAAPGIQGAGGGWAGGVGGGGADPGAGEIISEGGFEHSVAMDSVPGVRRRIWLGRSHHELGGYEGQESWSWEEIDGEQLSPEIIQAFSWEGDSEVTSWEAGPFEYPVEIPALVKESYSGPAKIFRAGGRTHVVWGPWQVIIKGLGAHAERRVISRWQMERAFTTRVWREVSTNATVAPLGSSGAGMGASERWGRAGSELRLMGASERYTLGASELRYAGASERAFIGASQLLMRGATERLFRGASELAYAGASERRIGGASELRYAGASERRLGGASEWRLGGGSELRLGGSEARLQATEVPRASVVAELPTEAALPPSGSLWPTLPAAGEG